MRIINFLLFFLIPVLLFCQTETIRGFVYEEASSEPIIFANISLKGLSIGGVSDDNGYFIFPNIPEGNYIIEVDFIGYEKKSIPINIIYGKKPSVLKIYLSKTNFELDAVDLSTEKSENKNLVNSSVIKLTSKSLEKLPSLGGEVDLAQFLQILPGVVFTGDQGGKLYIRGGAPIHNKVLLDGMTIYNPFHSIGFFSVFDSDLIKKTDVFTGGFPAKFGGRISSIMNIKTRDGNKKKISGKLSTNTFSSKVLIEGPFMRNLNKNVETSAILSLRSSYLDKTSKNFYSYISSDGLPYAFTDLYGKMSIFSGNGSKFNLYGFNFLDEVDYNNLTQLKWTTYGLGSNFVLVPGSAKMLIEGEIAYSNYNINERTETNILTSQINGFNLNLDFTYFMTKESEIRYGLQVSGYSTLLDVTNNNTYFSQTDHSTDFAAYIDYNFSKNRFVFNPGFRFQNYTSLGENRFEPRLSIKYNLTEKVRFKASGGTFSQNLISTNDDSDVVSLFTGFLSSTDNIPNTFQNNEINSLLQTATHYVLGLEYDLLNNLNINIEGYYKKFNQLIGINRNKIYEDIPEFADQPDFLKKDFMIEKGDAKGIDILVKYNTKKTSIWTVYSFGIVNREDEVQTYSPHYDRTHNFNMVFSYVIDKKKLWDFNLRWNYGSGFPFTQTQAYYENLDLSNINLSDFVSQNGDLGIIYSDLNEGRLPDYHRLDISLTRKINLKNSTSMEISLGVTNLYDRGNIFYYDRINAVRINQLPIMPNIGFNWSF
ncbi:MAG: TonB-dependent receptor [Bacteroidota bacterium]|nr:TonB-dependent receptor [Bacteroidota bacterium]